MRIVTTHKNSDFDAFASLIAATLIYPDAIPVLPQNINPNVRAFLSIHKNLFTVRNPKEIELENINSLIVVDADSWGRLEKFHKLRENKNLEIIIWDHHEGGDIETNFMHQEKSGSTISLLIAEIKKQKKLITPIQATLFLLGLYEDTGNLTFKSTTPGDALAAAFLLDKKADLGILSTFLHQAYGESQKNILFDMIKVAKREKINGYNISIANIDIYGHLENLSVVLAMYREILNVDAAFGIFNMPEKSRCFVIGRSKTPDINMAQILGSLGGGGHPSAASAMLKGVNSDVIEEMIYELLEGNQGTSVQLSDLMSYPVEHVKEKDTMREASSILDQKGYSGMPVLNSNDELVGVISRNDFKKLRKEKHIDAPVKAFMSTRVKFITPDKSPLEAVKIMIKNDIGRLPVVEDGKIIGIVSRTDAMLYFYDLLPD